MRLQKGSVVRVLDVDPELGRELDPARLSRARARAVAVSVTLFPGTWDPGTLARGPGHFGYLVIDGLLTRDVSLYDKVCTELLSSGDVLRPWDDDRASAPIPLEATWRVLEPTRLAVLDRRFTAVLGEWPELTVAFASRFIRRSRWLSCLFAVSQVSPLELRLLVLFWHLADRWGRVGTEGTLVPLKLTHEVIAKLVGVRRPSVSRALSSLREAGLLRRRRDGWLLLYSDLQDELARIERQASRSGR